MERSIPEVVNYGGAPGCHNQASQLPKVPLQSFFFGVSCLFFFFPSPFFSMLSHSSYLDITLWLFGIDYQMGRWDFELGSTSWEGSALWCLSWQPDLWLRYPFLLLCAAWIQQKWLPSSLGCWLKHWWTGSLNHSCWVGVPSTTKPGNSRGLSVHQLVAVLGDGCVEFKIDLSVQTDTWWITRCSWSHLM